VRLVADPDGLAVVDLRGRLPGRGAWVHATAACVGAVEREPRRLSAALKAPVRTDGLLEQLRAAVLRQVLDGISLAAAAGALVGGSDVVQLALDDRRVNELLVASDASQRTVSDVLRGREDLANVTVLPLDRGQLGARIGQAPRAVVGIVASSPFHHLREQLRRWRSLG
jgi:uncharacterized protein